MPDSLPETIYNSDSALSRPFQLLHDMARDIISARGLAWRLFVRNVSASYRQSFLGYAWAFLPPIVITFIWVFLNKYKILNVGETDIPYPLYVLLGTVLWSGFVEAMNSPIKMVSESRSLLTKINFPREALILAGMAEVLFNFTIRLLLIPVVFIWLKVEFPMSIFLAPLSIFALLALGLTIGILLTPVAMLYTDIQRGLTLATQAWFFFTPIVYTPPTSWPAVLITKANPVSPLLITSRELFVTGSISNPEGFLLVTGITFLMLFVGWAFYRMSMPHLIERLST